MGVSLGLEGLLLAVVGEEVDAVAEHVGGSQRRISPELPLVHVHGRRVTGRLNQLYGRQTKYFVIEIEVPAGRLFVRHARCPRGCDLMDPASPIRGHASVHLAYRGPGGEGHIRLDPAYGEHDNLLESPLAEGVVVEFACPRCGVSLEAPSDRCSLCSAPMFELLLSHGGSVEGCERKGCFHHRLRLVTGEEGMQRLFDRIVTDNYL